MADPHSFINYCCWVVGVFGRALVRTAEYDFLDATVWFEEKYPLTQETEGKYAIRVMALSKTQAVIGPAFDNCCYMPEAPQIER